MEDIEDLFKNEDDQIESRIPQSQRKILRNKKIVKEITQQNNKKNENTESQADECCGGSNEKGCCKSNENQKCEQNLKSQENFKQINQQIDEDIQQVPGSQNVYVKTYGCSHNISDSEYMAGLLADYGYTIVDDMNVAHACLINSCTVKNPSQEKFINLVQKAQTLGKPVIVSGCVPQGDRNLKGLEDVSVLGVTQIDRVVEVVEEALKGHKVKLLAKKDLPILDLPKIRKNQLVEIIPLSTGCLGSCTYCKTRHARGKLGSYDPNAIVERARQAIEEGVMEIWLTSEDTGAYGRDIDTDLPTLLKSIVKIMPGHVMLRLGMTNPPFILEHLQAMADILNHPRVYGFLHIPVQSGSNPVLDKMNREYTVEEFNEVCDFLTTNVQNMTIATDIICGFPYETEENHKETCELVKRHQFPVLNISQFYARPGTVAAKWQKVPSNDVKKRSTEVTNIFNSYNTNGHYLGTEQLVWIIGYDDRKSSTPDEQKQIMGHTKSYTKVVLSQDQETLKIDLQQVKALFGKCVKIKVTETHKWHISGHIVDVNPKPQTVSEDYFEKLDSLRKEKLRIQLQDDLANQKQKDLEIQQKLISNEPSLTTQQKSNKRDTSIYFMHFFGMVFLSIGIFQFLNSIF